MDIVLASDLAAPVKSVPPFLATLAEVFGSNPAAVLWLACQSHREFTPALLAALRASYCVVDVPEAELHPEYVSPTRRHSLHVVTLGAGAP